MELARADLLNNWFFLGTVSHWFLFSSFSSFLYSCNHQSGHMCTMSWDLSYSCCSSLVPIRTEQAWQKKCHTKSSTKPTDMWSQGRRLWKKEGESSQWWGTTPPAVLQPELGQQLGFCGKALPPAPHCFQKWSCSQMQCFPSVKWCVCTADLMYLFSYSLFLDVICCYFAHRSNTLSFSLTVWILIHLYRHKPRQCVLA